MKVGIDGVLLGAWANVESCDSMLDIGTGTGLIALMLAQRSRATVDAIDIDGDAILQAKENVENSPWRDRIRTQKISLQELITICPKQYDLIVSNPPYFVNSTKTPLENRTAARHTDSLSHEELIQHAKLLLKPTGRLCIILPLNEGFQCMEYADKTGLYCNKQVSVYPKPSALAKRLLLEFSILPTLKTSSELTIEAEERHHYSQDFSTLAKDFYLKL